MERDDIRIVHVVQSITLREVEEGALDDVVSPVLQYQTLSLTSITTTHLNKREDANTRRKELIQSILLPFLRASRFSITFHSADESIAPFVHKTTTGSIFNPYTIILKSEWEC